MFVLSIKTKREKEKNELIVISGKRLVTFQLDKLFEQLEIMLTRLWSWVCRLNHSGVFEADLSGKDTKKLRNFASSLKLDIQVMKFCFVLSSTVIPVNIITIIITISLTSELFKYFSKYFQFSIRLVDYLLGCRLKKWNAK